MTAKPVAASAVTMLHRPMPEEANTAGNMHGGYLLKHIDNVGSIVALRHARNSVVTVALDKMDFKESIQPGELLHFKASMNATGRSSMEIGVRVEVESLYTGMMRHVATCYMTFVAIDEQGKPTPVPPLLVSTEEETRRMRNAERRKNQYKLERNRKARPLTLGIERVEGLYALCRLDASQALPEAATHMPHAGLWSLTRTADEWSAVVPEEELAAWEQAGARVVKNRVAIRIAGTLEHSLTGILAELSTALAGAGVPIFSLATFDTDYILFPAEYWHAAQDCLNAVGYTVFA